LIEDIAYDRDSGQLLTGSLLDYGIPRADIMPAITGDFSPVLCTTNPLGAKRGGRRLHGRQYANSDARDPRRPRTARRHGSPDARHPRAHLARHSQA
jgi:hypothetical protein